MISNDIESAIETRAASARDVAGANTVQALSDLLTRILKRYGDVDATYEGCGRYDLLTGAIVPPGMESLREEFLAVKRAQTDTDRRRAWLKGDKVAADGDHFDEAAELACDACCALGVLGADHVAIINHVEKAFLSEDEEAEAAPHGTGHPVHVQPLAYQVSAVPETVADAHHFSLTVRYRGANAWCVQDAHGNDIDQNGGAEFGTGHRLSFKEALARATALAPRMTRNGFTVADAIAHPDGRTPRA